MLGHGICGHRVVKRKKIITITNIPCALYKIEDGLAEKDHIFLSGRANITYKGKRRKREREGKEGEKKKRMMLLF